MTEWKVKVPTKAQWEGWSVELRMELLARFLGFHVFYVNWICTNGTTPPLRDFSSVIEHIAPLIGAKRKKYIIAEDVFRCKKETQSYKELTVIVPLLYQHAIATFVGLHPYIKYLLSIHTPTQNLSLAQATGQTSHWVQELSRVLSMLYPRYILWPLLNIQRHLENCAQEVDTAV